MRNFISIMPISSPIPIFDHLLESSYRDDSNKWSNNIGEVILQVKSIEIHFTHLTWSSVCLCIHETQIFGRICEKKLQENMIFMNKLNIFIS